MTKQLHLIEGGDRKPWRLDAKQRQIGRQGVALARQRLAQARPSAAEKPLQRAG
jgi:hypothetical protein